jgi:acetyl-CoA acyltransferase 2
VTQTDNSTPYLARHVGLRSGLKDEVPALTVNRLCGSGFQSAITAAQTIALGEADVCLTGGAEAMSMAPMTLGGAARWGMRFGQNQTLEDSLFACLTDQNPNGKPTPMGITAENLAAKYGITREMADNYALQSQQRYQEGLAAGDHQGPQGRHCRRQGRAPQGQDHHRDASAPPLGLHPQDRHCHRRQRLGHL